MGMLRILSAALALVSPVWAEVVVATYNVENYLAVDRHVEGQWRPEYPKPEAEKAALRAVIRGRAPDVLALQEMGAAPYLEELRQDLRAEGLDYPFAIHLKGPDEHRYLAVLSRLVPEKVLEHPMVSFRFRGSETLSRRGVLELEFGSGTEAWTLYVVHLKSRWTVEPDDPRAEEFRVAEARAIRDLILRRYSNPQAARFLIVGDFNDAPRSRTLQAFLRRGGTEISRMVPAADSRGEVWTHFYARE
jgi:endonuclease/exonuclease/phosphatase family metal-dependent hydrolase